MNEAAIPEDIMTTADEVAANLGDDAREIVARAIWAERNRLVAPQDIDPLVAETIPADILEKSTAVTNTAEAVCKANGYMFGFPTVHGKETLDDEIAKALFAERRSQAERIAALERELTMSKPLYSRRQLEARLADALAALEWYANPQIYKPHPHGLSFDDRDVSFRARATLSRLKPEHPFTAEGPGALGADRQCKVCGRWNDEHTDGGE